MPLDLLLTALFLGTVAVALRGGPSVPVDLPPEDRPPVDAAALLPRGRRGLRRYVGRGLGELDAYLSVPRGLLPGAPGAGWDGGPERPADPED
jgi:hypothetical protein